MPPISDVKKNVQDLISKNKILIFSKTTCPYCTKAKDLFTSLGQDFFAYELDKDENGKLIQDILKEMTDQSTVPNIFINTKHIGGFSDLKALSDSGELTKIISFAPNSQYDYDLIVIGGGSGGLAASKEAASFGARVLVLDYVEPTPIGTTWGLGGTCVNVGCIPKKLMHQASILKGSIDDSSSFGWNLDGKVTHDWSKMVTAIQGYIRSLNWGYRTALQDKKVIYKNAYGSFIDKHTLQLRDKNGELSTVTSKDFIIATGERPRYLGIEGDKEHCITSDDLFSMKRAPGKTLVIGASYVALECAGFLRGLGYDTTVMVRSIFLRGFDQQMSELIGSFMTEHGVKFLRPCVPTKITKKPQSTPDLPVYEVTGQMNSGELVTDWYNTILVAIGRDPCTNKIGLENVGVKLDKVGRVVCNEGEQSSVPNIYAIGDILSHGLQLTPVAIQAGRLLANRLYNNSSELCDYINVPTTVFTPLEYGAIGYAEEDAIAKFSEENIEVFHTNFQPLEWTLPGHSKNACYCKIVCNKAKNNQVVGLHVLGPNAGEITQGFAIGMKLGATKHDFDRTIGIHPTCAEVFTTLQVSKSSGVIVEASGC